MLTLKCLLTYTSSFLRNTKLHHYLINVSGLFISSLKGDQHIFSNKVGQMHCRQSYWCHLSPCMILKILNKSLFVSLMCYTVYII